MVSSGMLPISLKLSWAAAAAWETFEGNGKVTH